RWVLEGLIGMSRGRNAMPNCDPLGRPLGESREFPLPPPAETLADSPRANCESWRATLLRLARVRVTGRYRDPMIGQHFHQRGLDLVSTHVLELARSTDFLAVDDRTSETSLVINQPAQ